MIVRNCMAGVAMVIVGACASSSGAGPVTRQYYSSEGGRVTAYVGASGTVSGPDAPPPGCRAANTYCLVGLPQGQVRIPFACEGGLATFSGKIVGLVDNIEFVMLDEHPELVIEYDLSWGLRAIYHSQDETFFSKRYAARLPLDIKAEGVAAYSAKGAPLKACDQ